MDTINSRIASVVDSECNGNKSEFARRLSVTAAYAGQLYSGQRTPSDRTIMDICREFNVNEVWLREGIGPMFVERSRRDDLFDYARRIIGGELTDVEASVLAVMAETTPEEWEIFAAKIRAVADGIDTEKEQADP